MTKTEPAKMPAAEPVGLTPLEAGAVAGGLNPQPLPPRWRA